MSAGKQGSGNAERSRWEPILSRAASDPAFRRRLLEEPRGALRSAFGIELPPGFRLKVIEKDPDTDVLLVLPDPHPGEELSEEELDAVAGGTDPTWEDPPPASS